MEILVDHLTRMAAGYVCVAGLDEEGQHVRPVLPGKRLTAELLAENGGPFAIGAVVDLGQTIPVGAAPEVEDHQFDPTQTRILHEASNDLLWATLSSNSELELTDIFGQDLVNRSKGAAVPPGAGARSLGTLEAGYRPRLSIRNDKIRCLVTDPQLGELDLSVTDVGLHAADGAGWMPRRDLVERIGDAIKAGRDVLLSVGLTRLFRGAHWLQVNNIHLSQRHGQSPRPLKGPRTTSPRSARTIPTPTRPGRRRTSGS